MHAGFVVKATRRCNLRCGYCRDWRNGHRYDMPFETVARFTASVLRDPEVTSAQFTWHGGEPTLLPLDFYRRAMLVQSRFRRKGQRIGNGIQTNGTLLDHEWCQFLAENGFRVGVSIDGPRTVQDVQRPYASGRGSSPEVERGLRLLKEWAIDFGILMVIDRATLERGPRALFDFVVELGIAKIGLISAKPANDATFFDKPAALRFLSPGHYTTQSEMASFLIGLYDLIETHPEVNLEIRELEALRRRVNGKQPGACTLAGSCVGRHFLVEANGDVAHCDLFIGDDSYTVGNLYDTSFAEIRRSQPITRLRTANDRTVEKMSSCPYYSICNGGCPHDRYLGSRYDPAHTTECCGQRDLIHAMRERLRLP